jgi:sialic acid synthase SpsE
MKKNIYQRKVKIISEIHPQHIGSIDEAKRMILYSKLGGADFVKVQLYDSKMLFDDNKRNYIQLSKKEFNELNNYANQIGINFFASIFDRSKIDWCEEADIKYYKIASRTIKDKKLCKEIINLKKKVFISLGMHKNLNALPYFAKNITYFYCVSKYPTQLNELKMPKFENSKIKGYSDHTIGTAACIYAASRGAEYIEKHFSCNKSLNIETQQAHTCSMDYDDLCEIRRNIDSITLIKSGE